MNSVLFLNAVNVEPHFFGTGGGFPSCGLVNRYAANRSVVIRKMLSNVFPDIGFIGNISATDVQNSIFRVSRIELQDNLRQRHRAYRIDVHVRKQIE